MRACRTLMHLVAVLPCVVPALLMPGCAGPLRTHVVYQSPNFWPCDGETISIGTYNLEGLARPERLARTLTNLACVDIWAFQEVNARIPTSSPSTGIVALQKAEPPDQLRSILPGEWHIFYVPVNPVGDPGQATWEGQAIASRYPLRNEQVWRLCATGNKTRVALACEVVITNTSFLVVNTDHEVAWTSIGPADRQKQVEDLITRIGPVPGPHTNAVILLGDFNTVGKPLQFWRRSSGEEIRNLRKSFRKINLKPLPGSEVPCRTFHRFGFWWALDHIFLRDVDCCRWGTTLNDQGSDHRPLWVTINRHE